ncbi:MAG: hypothetical protein HY319_00765 [Armatimonadetes bacterium]|nr:hypothetical protein [Armatimonadota bacterium]
MNALYLGIRSDSVRTEAVLADAAGRHLARASHANADSCSSRQLLERLLEEVLLGQPEPHPPLIAAVAVPGLLTSAHRRSAAELLREVFRGHASAVLCDELEPALAGGLGCKPGMLVRSGMQATVARVDEEGRFLRTESPSEPLGQEGSGLWLGTRTLQLAARMFEGRLPHSVRLDQALRTHFSSASMGELLHRIEQQAPGAEGVTELGSIAIELAGLPDPDPACRALVMRASRRLAGLIREAAGEAPELATTWTGSALHGALLEELRKDLPSAEWIEPIHSDLEGCLMLARASARCRWDDWIEDMGRGLWLAALQA